MGILQARFGAGGRGPIERERGESARQPHVPVSSWHGTNRRRPARHREPLLTTGALREPRFSLCRKRQGGTSTDLQRHTVLMGSYALPVGPSRTFRGVVLLAGGVLTIVLFGPVLKAILRLALEDDRYLQIAVGPVACALLLFWERTTIFASAQYSTDLGIPLLSIAVLTGVLAVMVNPSSHNGLLLQVGSMIFLWIAT